MESIDGWSWWSRVVINLAREVVIISNRIRRWFDVIVFFFSKLASFYFKRLLMLKRVCLIYIYGTLGENAAKVFWLVYHHFPK